MGKSCGKHKFFSLGGQYYSLGHPNDDASHYGQFGQNISKNSQGVYFLWNLTILYSNGLIRHQKDHKN